MFIQKLTWVLYVLVVSNLLVFISPVNAELYSIFNNYDKPVVVPAISSEKNIAERYNNGYTKKNVIKLAAARNEYEPASFIIKGIKENEDELAVIIKSLKNDVGLLFSGDVDVRVVKEWYQADGAWETHRARKGKQPVLVPELLLKNDKLIEVDHKNRQNYALLDVSPEPKYVALNEVGKRKVIIKKKIEEFPIYDTRELQPVNITKDDYKQFWLLFYVPKNAVPGVYRGKVEFEIDGMLIQHLSIPVELTIYPFELKKPILEYSIYYRGVLGDKRGSISSEDKTIDQLEYELKNMKSHGVSNPSLYQEIVSIPKLRQHLALRKKLGMNLGNLYYLGRTTGNPADKEGLLKLKNDVKKIKKIAKEYGFLDVFIYGIDEAYEEKLISQGAAWNSVHQAGGKVFSAGGIGHTKKTSGNGDLLVLYSKRGIKNEISAVHDHGNKVFKYAFPQVGVENPELYRKRYGFELWQMGFDGAMNYAYQHSMGDIWNDYDHMHYRDHVFAYPTSNGVIDTIAWEGFREGVDDIRYLSTLLDATSRVKTEYQKKQLYEVMAYLEHLKYKNFDDLAGVRARITELILNMNTQTGNDT